MDQATKAVNKVSVTFKSLEEVAAWSVAQTAVASQETDRVAACKRLSNVAAVLKALSFEETGVTAPEAFTVEMETAYAGAGLPGKVQDLTTKTDQKVTEAAQGAVQDNTGASGEAAWASNGTSTGQQNTAQTFVENAGALVRDLTANNNPQPGTPSASSSAGASVTGKAVVAKSDDAFSWPADMSGTRRRDGDGALLSKREARKLEETERAAEASAVAKRVTPGAHLSVPAGNDDSWGADPWARRE